MLNLVDISKDYLTGEDAVHALKNVNITFRQNEFVSILGPSGCGKTTLLNIVGGLDRYTSGDLIINGKSTKSYKDADWDAYRNKRIGFIFQNYNLIPHLNVLNNVELALTLAGVSPAERKARAIKVLNQVGLADKLNQKPNQLSGGQMQRVAIARALVNNPEIILADEPTGALDSVTSIQIMKLLAEIASDRLVIMVTHNSEIAMRYSTRIISLLDGNVINDTAPYIEDAQETLAADAAQTAAPPIKKDEVNSKDRIKGFFANLSPRKLFNAKPKADRTSMAFTTAIKLSFKNLLTKKVRTSITAVAGSIGIIGVGLVLAISNGFNSYIKSLERGVLGTFPIVISEMSFNTETLMKMNPMTLTETEKVNLDEFIDSGILIPKKTSTSEDMLQNLLEMVIFNNLTDEYFSYVADMDESLGTLQYTYSYKMHLLAQRYTGKTYFVDTTEVGWQQLLGDKDFILRQYDVIDGHYPTNPYQAVLIVDKYNRIDEKVITALGLDPKDLPISVNDIRNNTNIKLVYNDGYYVEDSGVFGEYPKVNKNKEQELYDNTEQTHPIEITGVLRIKKDMDYDMMPTGIGYTPELVTTLLNKEINSEVVKAQLISDTIDVTTGETFEIEYTLSSIMSMNMTEYLKMAGKFTHSNDIEYLRKAKLQELGGDHTPTAVYIYPEDFHSKNRIKSYLERYNDNIQNAEDKIVFTDMAEAATGMVEEIINIISIILVCFAAISLVVSSIMIGIITYVSVVERTKEIGILRSIGARKTDVSNVFNAETTIIGFTSGVFGILITYLLSIPINIIIKYYSGLTVGIAALAPYNALILIAISVALTFIAGLIPAGIAARRDPVVALRTE